MSVNLAFIPTLFALDHRLVAAAAVMLMLLMAPAADAVDAAPAPAPVITSSTTLLPGAAAQPVTLTAHNTSATTVDLAVPASAAADRTVADATVSDGAYDPVTRIWTLQLEAGARSTMQFTME